MDRKNEDTAIMDKHFPMRMEKVWLRSKNHRLPYYHQHQYFEISYILEGTGCVSVNGHQYGYVPGDVFIFNKDEVHGWILDTDLHLFVLEFCSDLIFDQVNLFDYEYLRFFESSGSHFVNKISKEEVYARKIYGVMEDIYNEWIHDDLGRCMMMKAYVLRILTMLTRHYKNSPKMVQVSVEKNEKMERLADVLQLIARNYDRKITLEEAAGVACMSTTYFSGFFRKAMGEPFSSYLIRFRVYQADEMLRNGNANVIEAAMACGFNNISNFYRNYKKVMQTTPGSIHKAQKNRDSAI